MLFVLIPAAWLALVLPALAMLRLASLSDECEAEARAYDVAALTVAGTHEAPGGPMIRGSDIPASKSASCPG